MPTEPIIAESAHKHGIDDRDMLHAFDNAIDAYDLDEGFVMLIGPARNAQLLEVGYVTSSDGAHIIVHATKARPKLLR